MNESKKKDTQSEFPKQLKNFLWKKDTMIKWEQDLYVVRLKRYLEDTLAESILQEEITSEGNNLLVAKIKDKKEIYFEASATPTPTPVKKEDKNTKTNQKK